MRFRDQDLQGQAAITAIQDITEEVPTAETDLHIHLRAASHAARVHIRSAARVHPQPGAVPTAARQTAPTPAVTAVVADTVVADTAAVAVEIAAEEVHAAVAEGKS